MKKVRTLLLWSLVLWVPLLLAGAGYAYYWYQVGQLAEQVRSQIASVAELNYESRFAQLDGVIGFNKVSLKPVAGPAVQLEQVRLTAPDALFWLTARDKFKAGDLPASLQLELLGMQWPVNAQTLPVAPPGELVWRDPQTLACGDIRQFTAREWQAMGYRSLLLDLNLRLTQPVSQRVQLELGADIDRVGKMQIQARANYRGQPNDAQSLMQADPQLELLTFSFQDAGYNQRRNRYCAKATGTEPAGYLAAHRQALQDMAAEQFAVALPDEVVDAYMQLQQPKAALRVSMRPQMNPMMLMMQQPEPADLLEQLQLQVNISGKPFDWQLLLNAPPVAEPGLAKKLDQLLPESPAESEAAEPRSLVQEPVAAEDIFAAEPAVAPAVKPEKEPGYRKVPWHELKNWVDRPVRLRTYFGRKVEGQLKQVEGERIQVLYRVGQGNAVFPVSRDRIENIEVYDSGR